MRAAILVTGLVGGMSIVAVSAPGKKFVETAGPAGMILGTALASCVGRVAHFARLDLENMLSFHL